MSEMEQMILWFNILGFAFLFSSLGATFVVYSRRNPGWLSSYLLYLGLYAIYTVFSTYEFFSRVYLSEARPFFNKLSQYITFIIAILLLIIVPRFIYRLFSQKLTVKQQIFPFVMAGLFLAMMALSLAFPERQLNNLGSVFLNAYLGIFTLFGIAGILKIEDRSFLGVVVPFLFLSCGFYFIVVLQNILLPLLVSPLLYLQLSHFTAGLICFSWGAITLIFLIIKTSRNDTHGMPAVNEEYMSRFGITAREKEIITLLLEGNSYKEIGEKLFVSHRTVETHVYNIYRKCSVKNKIELSRQLSSFK